MYKLLDYDITEYKQLENTLNELSKQGYNPTSLGKISRFEKNEKWLWKIHNHGCDTVLKQ